MIDMKLAGYHIVSNRHEVMVSEINELKKYDRLAIDWDKALEEVPDDQAK